MQLFGLSFKLKISLSSPVGDPATGHKFPIQMELVMCHAICYVRFLCSAFTYCTLSEIWWIWLQYIYNKDDYLRRGAPQSGQKSPLSNFSPSSFFSPLMDEAVRAPLGDGYLWRSNVANCKIHFIPLSIFCLKDVSVWLQLRRLSSHTRAVFIIHCVQWT